MSDIYGCLVSYAKQISGLSLSSLSLRFWILVIVICLLFVICDLEFFIQFLQRCKGLLIYQHYLGNAPALRPTPGGPANA